jgi:hypothetical protein
MKALSELKLAVLEARAALVIRRAEAEMKRFSPDQPRAPSGQPDGGQWIDAGGRVDVARLSEDECWALYDKDTFHCRMVGLRSCHAQAAVRYSDCLSGFTIRPLSY